MIKTVKLSDGRRVNLAHVTHTEFFEQDGGITPHGVLYLDAVNGQYREHYGMTSEQAFIQVNAKDLALVNAALDTFAVKIPQ